MSKDITLEIPRRPAIAVTSLALGALLGVSALSFADNNRATSNVTDGDASIPYRGFLMQDSTGANGPVTLRVRLYDSETASGPSLTHTYTTMARDGWFTLNITSSALRSFILDGDPIWISLGVLEDDGAGGEREIRLSGRQRIDPAVHAMWAGSSADMRVEGDLSVASSGRFVGPVQVQGEARFERAATLEKDLAAQGRIQGNALRVDGEYRVTGKAELVLEGVQAAGQAVTIADGAGTLHELSAQPSLFGDDGLTLRTLANPPNGQPIFRVLSSSGIERLRVEHLGVVSTNNDLQVTGGAVLGNTTMQGPLSVTGHITKLGVATYDADATGNGSSTTQTVRTTMTSRVTSACYLAKVDIVDHDDDNTSGCEIDHSSGNWRLNARARGSSNTITRCSAVCLTW